MTAPEPALFEPPDIGLPIDTWDELPRAESGPKCGLCGRRLRSQESRDAGVAPCCAAKIGRAVMAGQRAKEAS